MELKDELQLGITVVAMFAGPWLAVKGSIKQFRSQKWWERQGEVYGTLLENLAVLKHTTGAYLDYLKHPDYMLSPSTIIADQSAPAAAKIIQLASMGPYYLSENASKALDNFVAEWSIDTGCGTEDEYERRLKAVTQALDTVRREAHKSLSSAGLPKLR